MTTQNYLMIQNNVVTNVVAWDGDVNTWQPPVDATMAVQETTPSKVWALNEEQTDYVLINAVGQVNIGFTWDGSVATTNEPKPSLPTQET